ncbi:hypothetical protein ACFWP5_06265 [Streptomyces sp. NPDC058469]|uniref:hypothetical protein n=1 Tax=Streptomyces sp. NPDC058469 TaxID=3346514 RepID=UPI003650A5C4
MAVWSGTAFPSDGWPWSQSTMAGRTHRELALARTTASQAALDALPTVAANLGTDPEVAECLRTEYEIRLNTLQATETVNTPDERTRSAAIGLRDARRIDDAVLQRVQAQLDVEEVGLAPAADP